MHLWHPILPRWINLPDWQDKGVSQDTQHAGHARLPVCKKLHNCTGVLTGWMTLANVWSHHGRWGQVYIQCLGCVISYLWEVLAVQVSQRVGRVCVWWHHGRWGQVYTAWWLFGRTADLVWLQTINSHLKIHIHNGTQSHLHTHAYRERSGRGLDLARFCVASV